MRKKPTKSKRYKKLILLLGFLFILVILIATFLKFNLLSVGEIELKTNNVDCVTSDELKNTANLQGQNILFLNESSLEKRLKEKFLCIRKIKIHKNLPQKVILEVEGRQPVAILIESKIKESISTSRAEASLSAIEASVSAQFVFVGDGDKFLVDDEGVIFAKTSGDAPKVYFEGIPLTLGKKIEKEIVKNALKVLEKVKDFGVEVGETKIYSQNTLLVNSTPKMIFSLNSSIDLQVAALQLLLQQAKINEENMEFIDLRFEKPIIKYAPKKK